MPKVNDATGVGIAVLPVGAATDTRSAESTHLMSKVFPRQLCIVPHYTKENSLSFVPWSFHWIQFEGGPHTHAFARERLKGQALLDVIQYFFCGPWE